MGVFPFVLYITFCMFGLTNIITGVFCSQAAEIVERENVASVTQKIGEVFKRLDADKSGKVTWLEFQASLDEPEVLSWLESINVDPSEAKSLFDLMDFDRS